MSLPPIGAGHPDIQPVEHTIAVGGYPVRYLVAGAGEPVVLIHGLSGSGLWWRRNVAALAARHAVFLVDLPGFGAMRRSPQPFALDTAMAWLRQWMRAVGLRRANLVGHSMGGYLALRLAAEHPEMVRRLVLAAPACFPSPTFLAAHLLPLATAMRHLAPSFLPLLAYDALRAGPITLLRAARAIVAQDAASDLTSIAAPTLLVWGQHDALVPPSLGDALRQDLPNSRLLVLPRAGHVVMYDQPHAFNTATLTFLAGLPIEKL